MAYDTIKKNAIGLPYRVQISRNNVNDNLSIATLPKFYMKLSGGSVFKVNTATATFESQAADVAVIRYDWGTADLDTPGLYEIFVGFMLNSKAVFAPKDPNLLLLVMDTGL